MEILYIALLTLLGAQIAKRVVDRIPQHKFRIVITVFLLAVGVKLIFWR